MPVILEESAYDSWLSGDALGADAKRILLDNHLDSQLESFRVGREVNSSRYEGTDIKKPLLNSLQAGGLECRGSRCWYGHARIVLAGAPARAKLISTGDIHRMDCG